MGEEWNAGSMPEIGERWREDPHREEVGPRGDRAPGRGRGAGAVALGARSGLGRGVDAQRALARAARPVARPRSCRPGVEPPRSALLRADRAVLDRPSVVQHVARVLHRGVPAAPACPAGPVRRAPAAGDGRVLWCLPAVGRGVPVDSRGAPRGARDPRLRPGDVPLCRAAFRRALPLPHAGRTRRPARTRDAWIGSSRWASAASSSSWQTSSPAPSPTRTCGSIAGSSPPGSRRRKTGSAQGATLVLLAVTAAMLFAEARAPRRSLPRVLYVLGIAAMVAIALRPRSLFLFLVIWNSQHWILATGLGSQTPSGEPAPVRGAVRRVLHALNTRPWAVVLLLMVVVGPPPASLRGRSEPGGGHVLRGPDIRRRRDGIAYVLLGPRPRGPRLFDGVHPLPPRPGRLPTVGPPGPLGGAWAPRSTR